MIYDHSDTCFESEKERNLYYKIFAGYLFNELIPGHDLRVKSFFDLLKSPVAIGKVAPPLPVSLDPRSTHVSFDNHLYLFHELETDRGEFADILLHDVKTRTIFAIEAKLHSNWSHDKDIVANQKRHFQLHDALHQANVVPVLLLMGRRWTHATQKGSDEHSNYSRLREDPQCRFRVILWEQIAEIIQETSVRDFLISQLSRPERGFFYRSSQDWFIQVPSVSRT